jgi:hypothetical protein
MSWTSALHMYPARYAEGAPGATVAHDVDTEVKAAVGEFHVLGTLLSTV